MRAGDRGPGDRREIADPSATFPGDPAYGTRLSGTGYFGGAAGASSFQVSRTWSHFPSVLCQVEMNLPVSTLLPPGPVTLNVPADQPTLPETATV
jgi:hypothetical protein